MSGGRGLHRESLVVFVYLSSHLYRRVKGHLIDRRQASSRLAATLGLRPRYARLKETADAEERRLKAKRERERESLLKETREETPEGER